MFILILFQLVYAIHKKAPEAIRLDAAMLVGSIMILADFFNSWIILDIQMMFFILGDFYMVIKMREL